MRYANLQVAVTDIAVKNSLITAPPILATEVLWNLPALIKAIALMRKVYKYN